MHIHIYIQTVMSVRKVKRMTWREKKKTCKENMKIPSCASNKPRLQARGIPYCLLRWSLCAGLEWKHADLRNWGSKRNIILIFRPCLSTAVRHMKEVAVVSSTRREGRHSSQFLLAGGVSGRPSSQSWIIISLTARNELQE